jgi:hypothetical protein
MIAVARSTVSPTRFGHDFLSEISITMCDIALLDEIPNGELPDPEQYTFHAWVFADNDPQLSPAELVLAHVVSLQSELHSAQ